MTQVSPEQSLYMALELSNKTWRIALSNGMKIRQVSVAAGNRAGVLAAIEQARQRWGLASTALVYSC